MAFLTEQYLNSVLDLPVALPTMDIVAGDWVVIATVSVSAPQKLVYDYVNLQIVSSSVNLSQIAAANLIAPGLGLAYLGIFQNYNGTPPNTLTALDVLSVSNLGVVQRTASPLNITSPGNYSVVIVNNCQFSADSSASLPASTSIDFLLQVTGQFRLYLNAGT